jgi:hypothetical protein
MSEIRSRQASNFRVHPLPVHPEVRHGHAEAVQLVAGGQGPEHDALLQHHGRPPEGVRVMLVVTGRVDPVPGG